MQFLLLVVLLCICIHPYSAYMRVHRVAGAHMRGQSSSSLGAAQQRSWLENLLLPVKEPANPLLTVGEVDASLEALDKEVSENFDKRFLDDNEEYENMQVASSMEEWLKSPAFAQDRSLMRKRPPVWPGNRPPLPNFRRLDQSMDAAWGRGKYRREIWEDDVNPITDWTVSFEPSEEEIDALFGPKPFWFNGKSSIFALRSDFSFFHPCHATKLTLFLLSFPVCLFRRCRGLV